MRITYLTADGRYHRKRAKLNGDRPRHLLNGAGKQAHSLSENPVYIQATDPFHLKTPTTRSRWAELEGDDDTTPLPIPPPPTRAEGLGILCEDGAKYPITIRPFHDSEARQKEEADTHAEAFALARAAQARSNNASGLMGAGFIMLMLACMVLILVIAVVALQARFGGEELPVTGDEGKVRVIDGVNQWQ